MSEAAKVPVTLFSDYVCPFCYVAKERAAQLEEAYGIEVVWKAFELRSLAPGKGLPAEMHHNGDPNLKHVGKMARTCAEDVCLPIGDHVVYSNSRMAFELGALAEDHNQGRQYRDALFQAYFVDKRDIGERDVLLDIAQTADLPGADASRCLDDRTHSARIDAELAEARDFGITGVPTFVIGSFPVVGAQPIESLRFVYDKLAKKIGKAI